MDATTRGARVVSGALLWAAIAAASAIGLARLPKAERARAREALEDVIRLHVDGAPRREVLFTGSWPWLQPGDGVYLRKGSELVRVGQVIEVGDADSGRRVAAFFDPAVAARFTVSTRLVAFSSGASIAWTWRALLPESVRAGIRGEWEAFLAKNQSRFEPVLRPLAAELVRSLAPLLAAETQAALERHREELDAIGKRYRDDVLKPRILPLLRGEIWPLLIEHGRPALLALGQDLWDALPILGLAWNGVFEGLDWRNLPHLEQRFQRYLDEQAFPILRRHSAPLEQALLEVLRRAADDPEVAATIRESLSTLLKDAELRDLLVTIVDEVARSDALRSAFASRLSEPETKKALDELRFEIDAVFQRIGRRIVFADEDTLTVHPEFSRFLRTLVLKKDRRWVLLEEGEGGPPLRSDAILPGVVAEE